MDFKTPTRVLSLLEQVDRLYRSEVQPREEALRHRLTNRDEYLDTDGRIHPEVQQARREIMAASGQAGLYSLHLPEGVGGGGLSRTEMFFVEEKVYSYGIGLNPAMLSWTDGATPRLLFCTAHQREQFVDPLVRGEKTSFNAVTEPHAGSNFFDFTTRAVRKGDQWVLSGAGIMKNSEINKLFQIARNLRIPGGADEVQRSTIAETLGLRAGS